MKGTWIISLKLSFENKEQHATPKTETIRLNQIIMKKHTNTLFGVCGVKKKGRGERERDTKTYIFCSKSAPVKCVTRNLSFETICSNRFPGFTFLPVDFHNTPKVYTL